MFCIDVTVTSFVEYDIKPKCRATAQYQYNTAQSSIKYAKPASQLSEPDK